MKESKKVINKKRSLRNFRLLKGNRPIPNRTEDIQYVACLLSLKALGF